MSKKLMAHLVYGYPDVNVSQSLMKSMFELGVEYIEVQIPFSDPIADGITLAKANSEASRHITTTNVLTYLNSLTLTSKPTKVLVMCYFQTIYSYGLSAFCKAAAQAGILGIIVPDIPYDQHGYNDLIRECLNYDLVFVPVLSPNVTKERIKKYLHKTTKLVYLTARMGITGTHTTVRQLSSIVETTDYINLLAPTAEISLGFGIQTIEDIYALPSSIDTVVIGSAITQKLISYGEIKAVAFIKELLIACRYSSTGFKNGTMTNKYRD